MSSGDLHNQIEAARRFAVSEVRRFLGSELHHGEGRGPMAIACWFGFQLTWVDGPDGAYISMPNAADDALVSLAWKHADVRDLVINVISSRIRNGQILTKTLRTFAVLALEGQLPNPKVKRGRKASELFERNLFLIDTLKVLKVTYGLVPTHNDERTQDSMRISGAELLSECFRALGRHEVTPRAVKEVWKSKVNQRWAARIEEEIKNYQPPTGNALAAIMGR